MAERLANDFATALSSSVSSSATSLPVAAAAPTALQGGEFRVRVDDELMLVTATGSGGSSPWTVTRGAEGTTAAAHASAAVVTHVLTAGALGAMMGGAPPFEGARVTLSSSIPGSGTTIYVGFDTFTYNSGSLTLNEYGYVKPATDGLYLCHARVVWNYNDSGSPSSRLLDVEYESTYTVTSVSAEDVSPNGYSTLETWGLYRGYAASSDGFNVKATAPADYDVLDTGMGFETFLEVIKLGGLP